LSQEQADEVARRLALADLLAYADALHQEILGWLGTLPDEMLDSRPNVPVRLARYPVYLDEPMRHEVPWMYQNPPLWRCLAPAIGHNRDHLAEIDLLKRQWRGRKS